MSCNPIIPNFIGPVPNTSESGEPFGGAGSPVGLTEPRVSELLSAHQYVDEEYIVSGTVDGQPYATLLLVRRPQDPQRFSGLVALEPIHIQGALGLWYTGHTAILESGHAWVAIGSQREAVEGPIKTSNPIRYANLQVPTADAGVEDEVHAALNRWTQSNDTQMPPPALFAMDKISNEIMTQVGAVLKGGSGSGPLPGLLVKYLIMGGASQTGHATLNYIRGASAAARLSDGRPVYDGYLPMAAPSWQAVAGGDAAVIQIFAEGDLVLFDSVGPSGYMGARLDGDAPNDRFRSYQIVGSSHLPTRGLKDVAGLPQLGVELQSGERFTQFPSGAFCQGALVNLVNWITKGVSPPKAPPIEIVNGEIVRDEFGNAQGGVRSPYVDVPTARYITARYVRNLIGVEVRLPPETLRRLYKSRTTYLQSFNHGIDRLIEGRWILAADGERLKMEEAQSPPF